MTQHVIDRYQDRLACPRCGSLLERWGTSSEGGHWYPTPTVLPLDDARRMRLPFRDADIESRSGMVRSGGMVTPGSAQVVAVPYFCAACNMDVLASQTRPYRGEMPDCAMDDGSGRS